MESPIFSSFIFKYYTKISSLFHIKIILLKLINLQKLIWMTFLFTLAFFMQVQPNFRYWRQNEKYQIYSLMYMRYYPKEYKPVKRLNIPSSDKGKKHFWGYDKGDYGFYKSEDQEYIRISNSHNKQRRSRTTDLKQDPYIIQLTEPFNPEYFKLSKKKDVNKLSFQNIRLPPILTQAASTQTNPINSQQYKSIQHEQIDNRLKIAQKIINQSQKRKVETQPTHNLYKTNQRQTKQLNFSPSVRFSPTYVCSIQNPLPSYILKPHHYRTRSYKRVENHELTNRNDNGILKL